MGSGHADRLEAFLRSSHSAGEPELKATLSRLASEIKERLDKGSPGSRTFVLSAVRALSRLKGTANGEVRAACLADSITYLFANQCDLEALEGANQLELLARAIESRFWLRKARSFQGIAYAHLGNVAEAVLSYSIALEISYETHDFDGQASTLSNLGTALNYGGLYREAIPCFAQAISIAHEHSLNTFEGAALCNLAQSYLFLEDYEKGFRAITKSLEICVEPETAFLSLGRSIREFTFVQLALELGKLSAAREHATKCAHYAQRAGTRRGEHVALVAKGLCEVHGGDVSKGLELLEKAVLISGEEGTPTRWVALNALVRGYDHAGQPELALSRMRVLLSTIRVAREKGLLALISGPMNHASPVVLATEQNDLQAFELREAHLRAQVAEREVTNSRVEMLERLAVAADLKEEETGAHGYRVGRLSSLLATELNWTRQSCDALDIAARLHDIGKISVPDRILLSPGALQEAERHFISAHTTIGAELLAKSNIPQLRLAEEIARHHHEWWNGEGYPSKLKGKRIPIHARIVALADVFDALTHGRPFSQPWTMDRAIEEIKSRKGTQFDPELTDVFLALIERLRNEHQDLDEYLGRAGRNSPFLQARNKIRMMLAEERDQEKKATVEGNETRH
jgi:putative two-component system response regulator